MKGSLQIKNGKYYAVLSVKDDTGKFKKVWVSTGLTEKGNKRKAEQKLNEIIVEYSNKEISEFQCKIGDFQLNDLSEVAFKVLPTDKFGYLYIQIDMKIFDSLSLDNQSGNCIMNIKTEIGLLETFGKRISKLKECENNIIVSLIN